MLQRKVIIRTINLINLYVMRKFYLFFAGALLSIPAVSYAQGLVRYPDDPKVIFRQDFEVEDGLNEDQAYKKWSTTPIDTIHELEYYSKIGTSSISRKTDIYDGSADWEIFAVRTDSTSSEYTEVQPGDGIVMFNGADPTSSKDETAAGVYNNDHWSIVGDNGTDIKRKTAFSQYGEDGGKYYFQWTTGPELLTGPARTGLHIIQQLPTVLRITAEICMFADWI